jgi:uncharacterized cupredoxin-like copper-binding protein
MRPETLLCANQHSTVNCPAFKTIGNRSLITPARRVKLLIITLLLLAMLIFTGYRGSSLVIPLTAGEPMLLFIQRSVPDSDSQQIEVTLDEFSISPNPLRIPAGQPVTLVIRNVGKIPHEFMAGREAQDNDFEHDLFAGLHVNTWSEASAEPAPNGHVDSEGGSGHHGGDHEHGTMVVPEPGQTAYLSFTLPESKRGEWSMACFLPGHYAAGMYAALIVE